MPNNLPHLTKPKAEVEKALKERKARARDLSLNGPIENPSALDKAISEYDKWTAYNNDLLRLVFDSFEISYSYVNRVTYLTSDDTPQGELQYYRDSLKIKLEELQSILERLDLYHEATQLAAQAPSIQTPAQLSNRVFIVHGHDNVRRLEVEKFLRQLGLEPIILAEQPNQGRTVIEKLEAYRDVGFAIVLLTPDDLGALASDKADLQPRARQNVILELGYFFGILGRAHVCALIKDTVEKPSDILGIVWVDFDDRRAWRLALAQEMSTAGLDIDFNKLKK